MKGVSLVETTSIVPVVLALLLFFGSVVSAINTVEKKNARIDLTVSLVRIVDSMTSGGVLTEEKFYDIAETLAQSTEAFFYVCVTSYDDDRYAKCKWKFSWPREYEKYEPKDFGRHAAKSGEIVAAAFPVTVQTEVRGIPFNEVNRLLVITWQGR